MMNLNVKSNTNNTIRPICFVNLHESTGFMENYIIYEMATLSILPTFYFKFKSPFESLKMEYYFCKYDLLDK